MGVFPSPPPPPPPSTGLFIAPPPPMQSFSIPRAQSLTEAAVPFISPPSASSATVTPPLGAGGVFCIPTAIPPSSANTVAPSFFSAEKPGGTCSADIPSSLRVRSLSYQRSIPPLSLSAVSAALPQQEQLQQQYQKGVVPAAYSSSPTSALLSTVSSSVSTSLDTTRSGGGGESVTSMSSLTDSSGKLLSPLSILTPALSSHPSPASSQAAGTSGVSPRGGAGTLQRPLSSRPSMPRPPGGTTATIGGGAAGLGSSIDLTTSIKTTAMRSPVQAPGMVHGISLTPSTTTTSSAGTTEPSSSKSPDYKTQPGKQPQGAFAPGTATSSRR